MRIRVCQKLLIAFVAVETTMCMAAGHSDNVTESELLGFFESIERNGTNIVFTTHRGGGRFYYAINGQDGKVSEYGETIVLAENSEMKIHEYHRSLTISPLQGDVAHKGFRLLLKKDSRSRPDGILATNYAYMVYLDEKPDSSGGEKGNSAPEGNRAMVKSAGVPEKGAERKCLKGLTLLPCEEKEQ